MPLYNPHGWDRGAEQRSPRAIFTEPLPKHSWYQTGGKPTSIPTSEHDVACSRPGRAGLQSSWSLREARPAQQSQGSGGTVTTPAPRGQPESPARRRDPRGFGPLDSRERSASLSTEMWAGRFRLAMGNSAGCFPFPPKKSFPWRKKSKRTPTRGASLFQSEPSST